MRARFPVSDHCDGYRFFNPGGEGRTALQALRWRLRARREPWQPPGVGAGFAPPPDTVAPGTAAISFINHASFLIRFPGSVVLTDPIFSERCSPVSWAGPRRARPPGIPLAALPRPDVVLLSHSHYDHMDLPSLRELQRRHAPRIVTMLGNARSLGRLGIDALELDWWQDITIGPLSITATPARHVAARTLFDFNRSLWGGFMIREAAGQVLFAGDSGAGPHWAEIHDRLGAPDVALLPIGAYEPRWFMAAQHVDPGEAVRIMRDIGTPRAIGIHWGTFQLTDEGREAPVTGLAAALAAEGLDPDAFVAGVPGSVYDIA